MILSNASNQDFRLFLELEMQEPIHLEERADPFREEFSFYQ